MLSLHLGCCKRCCYGPGGADIFLSQCFYFLCISTQQWNRRTRRQLRSWFSEKAALLSMVAAPLSNQQHMEVPASSCSCRYLPRLLFMVMVVLTSVSWYRFVVRKSIPRQVDKKSRGPQGERGLEFSRRKKGQTFFFSLHSLGLYNNNVSCLRTVSGKNLLANPVILECKLWEWV